jgi:hypothetical protein
MITGKNWPLLGVLALSLFLGACADSPLTWPKKRFSAEEWKKTPDIERYVFAADLLDGMLIGLTRQQVGELLGTDGAGNVPANGCYVIKEIASGYNATENICVRFDASGRVNNVFLHSD